jgi:hypothetical protein
MEGVTAIGVSQRLVVVLAALCLPVCLVAITGCGRGGASEPRDDVLEAFGSADVVVGGTILEISPPPEFKTGFLGVARQVVRIRVDAWFSEPLGLPELDVSHPVLDPPTATADGSRLDPAAFPTGTRVLVPIDLVRAPVGDGIGGYVLAADAGVFPWTDELARRIRRRGVRPALPSAGASRESPQAPPAGIPTGSEHGGIPHCPAGPPRGSHAFKARPA